MTYQNQIATIRICNSNDGAFIRASYEVDGCVSVRDITPSDDCDLDDRDDVVFEVEYDLVGGWSEGVDWSSAEIVDER